MDANERARFIDRLPAKALKTSLIRELKREYSLYEIAIMTRGAAARLLGTPDRGHLGAGGVGDVSVYTDQADRTAMFARADYVFKDGNMIVKEGVVLEPRFQALMVKPRFDRQLARRSAPITTNISASAGNIRFTAFSGVRQAC
jgi:formylmethanofuran dehydrogenase subunit A